MKYSKSGLFQVMFTALLAALIGGTCTDALARGKRHVAKKAPKPETYAGRLEAEMFASDMANRGVDATWVQQSLSQAQKLESVINAVKPGPGGQRKNWEAYRDRFVEPVRTEAGRQFMQEYAEPLNRASSWFGIPPEVIVGILGVETIYGRNTGSYRVVDSLATLAFDYPKEGGRDRSTYFREQLAQFFEWCAKERCQPLSVTGSYAGAMGMPQFMPGNIHRYGMDFDGDGHIDLFNPVDAIGSVARFLALHGWVRQLVPTVGVDVEGADLDPLLEPDILPTFTSVQLVVHGAKPHATLLPWEKYALVELQNGDDVSDYVLGTRNFYVLTRYNRSSYYAMAVLELGRQVVAEGAEAKALSNTKSAIKAAGYQSVAN